MGEPTQRAVGRHLKKKTTPECISLRDLWSGLLWNNFKPEGTASPSGALAAEGQSDGLCQCSPAYLAPPTLTF